eukprot:1958776-Rhodomonas_salina.1
MVSVLARRRGCALLSARRAIASDAAVLTQLFWRSALLCHSCSDARALFCCVRSSDACAVSARVGQSCSARWRLQTLSSASSCKATGLFRSLSSASHYTAKSNTRNRNLPTTCTRIVNTIESGPDAAVGCRGQADGGLRHCCWTAQYSCIKANRVFLRLRWALRRHPNTSDVTACACPGSAQRGCGATMELTGACEHCEA